MSMSELLLLDAEWWLDDGVEEVPDYLDKIKIAYEGWFDGFQGADYGTRSWFALLVREAMYA